MRAGTLTSAVSIARNLARRLPERGAATAQVGALLGGRSAPEQRVAVREAPEALDQREVLPREVGVVVEQRPPLDWSLARDPLGDLYGLALRREGLAVLVGKDQE